MKIFKYTALYEDFKRKEIDKREEEQKVANVSVNSTYSPELIKTFNLLKTEDTKLMDMREKYLKLDRNNIKERDVYRAALNIQYKKVVELELEFQRLISYEERNYKEEKI